MATKFLTLVLVWIMALAMPTSAQIIVAAAADLNAALSEIAANYERSGGSKVRLSFGSSGNLFSQSESGGGGGRGGGADVDYPKKLIEAGLAEKSSLYRYAVGRLVLWVPSSSPLDVEHDG